MVASHLSQFGASEIRVPTLGSFVNDMGHPLDHGFDEAEEPQGGSSDDAAEAGPSGTQWQEDGVGAHLGPDVSHVNSLL